MTRGRPPQSELGRWRQRHGLTQQQAAAALRVSQPTYSRWERTGPPKKLGDLTRVLASLPGFQADLLDLAK